jgi:hypothetical protein
MKGTTNLNKHLSKHDKEALTWLVLELLEEGVVDVEKLASFSFQLTALWETIEEEE